jgi:type III secretion system low calcium response chaperone LcrH/SycD
MKDEESTVFDEIENVVLLEIGELMTESAEKLEEEWDSQNKLISPQAQQERKKLELMNSIHSIKKDCMRLDAAFEIFERNKHRFLLPEEVQNVFNDIQTVGLHLDREALLASSHHLKGKTLQEIFGISDLVLFCFYKVGHALYAEKAYRDAAQVFFFLTILSPFVKDYWLALGMAEKLSDDYEQALYAFAMASLMNINDPEPHLHATECYILLKNVPLAVAELEMAKKFIPHHENPEKWKVHLETIQRELGHIKAVA